MTQAGVALQGKAGDTRDLILRAALRVFTEKGFDGASTREIASAAGVNHGLIRHYFGSKQKLWQASVDLAWEEMGAGLDSFDSGPVDRQRAGRLIRGHVHFVARNPEFVRLMFEEGKRRGPRMRWIVDRHVKPLYQSLASLLERGQARGSLPPDLSPLHFFYILAGAAGLVFHQAEECKRLTGVDPFDPEVVEEHARVVEQLFLGPSEERSEG